MSLLHKPHSPSAFAAFFVSQRNGKGEASAGPESA
jgi:hypothetical protein